jgi:hypothetical protein
VFVPWIGEILVDVDGHRVRPADLLVDRNGGVGRGVPHLLGDLEAALRPARGLLRPVRRVTLQVLHGLGLQPARVAEVVPGVAAHRRRPGEARGRPAPGAAAAA